MSSLDMSCDLKLLYNLVTEDCTGKFYVCTGSPELLIQKSTLAAELDLTSREDDQATAAKQGNMYMLLSLIYRG